MAKKRIRLDRYPGLSRERLSAASDNPREQAFARHWTEENDRPLRPTALVDILLPEATDRDRAVAATIIQWLGTNVGMAFLEDVIRKCPQVRQWVLQACASSL